MRHDCVQQRGELGLSFNFQVLDLAGHIRDLNDLDFLSVVSVNLCSHCHVLKGVRLAKLDLENDVA